jgi:hypothetical protein
VYEVIFVDETDVYVGVEDGAVGGWDKLVDPERTGEDVTGRVPDTEGDSATFGRVAGIVFPVEVEVLSYTGRTDVTTVLVKGVLDVLGALGQGGSGY